MYSFRYVDVGWTDDGKVVLGIAEVKAAFSITTLTQTATRTSVMAACTGTTSRTATLSVTR